MRVFIELDSGETLELHQLRAKITREPKMDHSDVVLSGVLFNRQMQPGFSEFVVRRSIINQVFDTRVQGISRKALPAGHED